VQTRAWLARGVLIDLMSEPSPPRPCRYTMVGDPGDPVPSQRRWSLWPPTSKAASSSPVAALVVGGWVVVLSSPAPEQLASSTARTTMVTILRIAGLPIAARHVPDADRIGRDRPSIVTSPGVPWARIMHQAGTRPFNGQASGMSFPCPRRPTRGLWPPANQESAASPVRVRVSTVVVTSSRCGACHHHGRCGGPAAA
jgi:hypothetical protein